MVSTVFPPVEKILPSGLLLFPSAEVSLFVILLRGFNGADSRIDVFCGEDEAGEDLALDGRAIPLPTAYFWGTFSACDRTEEKDLANNATNYSAGVSKTRRIFSTGGSTSAKLHPFRVNVPIVVVRRTVCLYAYRV